MKAKSHESESIYLDNKSHINFIITAIDHIAS
jgi:hypothetical protein